MTVNMAVKLDEKTRSRLKALSKARQRSAHWLMKEAIGTYLEREEDIERRNREADAAREAFERTREGVRHEDMAAWLESWGTSRGKKCPAPKHLN